MPLSPLVMLLLQGADDQALFDKFHARIEKSPGFHAEYKGSINGKPLTSVIDLKFPVNERADFKIEGQNATFILDLSGEIVLDHDDREYIEYSPIGALSTPPPVGLLKYAVPLPLVSHDPVFRNAQVWKRQSTDPAKGNIFTAGVGDSALTMALDNEGRLTYYRSVVDDMGKQFITEYNLVSDDITDKGQSKIVAEPEIGYAPGQQRVEFSNPVCPMQAAWPTFIDSRSDKEVHLAQEWKGKRYVIVATSPDCDASKAAEPELKELREQMGTLGVEMAEISLVAEKSDLSKSDPNRKVVHLASDKASTELWFSMTPYFLMVDEKGQIVGGFAGFDPNHKKDLLNRMLELAKIKPGEAAGLEIPKHPMGKD